MYKKKTTPEMDINFYAMAIYAFIFINVLMLFYTTKF